MDQIQDLVTKYAPGPGLLPLWNLIAGSTAVIYAFQNLASDSGSKLVYLAGARKGLVNTLQSRNFALWSLTNGIVRFYFAYNVGNPVVYDITLATYVIATLHFLSEWLVFRTCALGGGVVSPLIVAGSSIVWMTTQREFYLGA
ncbi:ergosterol biosynthesis protein Erg28 [Calocera cornea HHB12733]|uniref:Ergosterol biosynthesis protein Erg28 n=1 Tax=Calocera cornea HHB12733 TaxID=1353952 RepID=A0A165HCT7_9BASI|nr:ergosterol biosynthesis protein Erg28 [Calocera cornea HHB12733]